MFSASLALFAIPFSIVAAFVIVIAVPWNQTATAHNRHDLRTMGYGYPLAWFHQDQRWLSPPSYPDSERWTAPQDSPTSFEPAVLIEDWAIIASVLAVSLLLVGGLVHTAGRLRPTSRAPGAIAPAAG